MVSAISDCADEWRPDRSAYAPRAWHQNPRLQSATPIHFPRERSTNKAGGRIHPRYSAALGNHT